MPRTLTFEHDYPVDPDRLFALVTDLDTLDAVTKPWVQFDHLPSGPVHAGQVIDVAISVFGILPSMPYRMRVIECDPDARSMTSDENGLGIHRLVHALQVLPDPAGARLVDRIDIDAGWMTPLVALWAWVIYRWRHPVRMRLLARE